jgi:hypothetical protein
MTHIFFPLSSIVNATILMTHWPTYKGQKAYLEFISFFSFSPFSAFCSFRVIGERGIFLLFINVEFSYIFQRQIYSIFQTWKNIVSSQSLSNFMDQNLSTTKRYTVRDGTPNVFVGTELTFSHANS